MHNLDRYWTDQRFYEKKLLKVVLNYVAIFASIFPTLTYSYLSTTNAINKTIIKPTNRSHYFKVGCNLCAKSTFAKELDDFKQELCCVILCHFNRITACAGVN